MKDKKEVRKEVRKNITKIKKEFRESPDFKEIQKDKKGKYIRIDMWDARTGSSHQSHAKSVTDAINTLRQSHIFYPNWKLEFISQIDA